MKGLDIHIILDFLEEDTRKYCHIEFQYLLVSSEIRKSNNITVEPLYNEVLGTMKITLLYQVSHYIRVKKQRNIKSWDQQNYLVIRRFCYIRPRYNEVPLYYLDHACKIMPEQKFTKNDAGIKFPKIFVKYHKPSISYSCSYRSI